MSNKSSNRIVVPEAREALDRFKMEAANEVGVNLKEGYYGHLTSREAGRTISVPPARTSKVTSLLTPGDPYGSTHTCTS